MKKITVERKMSGKKVARNRLVNHVASLKALARRMIERNNQSILFLDLKVKFSILIRKTDLTTTQNSCNPKRI